MVSPSTPISDFNKEATPTPNHLIVKDGHVFHIPKGINWSKAAQEAGLKIHNAVAADQIDNYFQVIVGDDKPVFLFKKEAVDLALKQTNQNEADVKVSDESRFTQHRPSH